MRIAIFDMENWKETLATLSRNKTRTFLTGFGIFWGVAMLAMLMGGAKGGEGLLRRNFAGFATNSGGMFPENTSIPYKGYQKGRSWQIDISDVEMLKASLPDMEAIVPTFQRGNVSSRHGKNSFAGNLTGTGPEYTVMLQPKMYSGRFINEADEANERRVAVVGKKVITQLFPENDSPLGELINVNGTAYNIIGVVGDTSEIKLGGSLDESVIIPGSTFRRAYGYGSNVDFVIFVAKDNRNLSAMIPKMRRLIYRRHNIHPNDKSALWVMNIAEQFEQVDTLFKGVDILAIFIGFATLLAGIIGIGNIMWVIVKERTQEIGIRRAIGAKPRDIIAQVLSEGTILTVIAGTAGLCFATLILGILQQFNNPPDAVAEVQFQMSFTSALTILGTFILLGILASLIPSIKAMKIKPIEALNSK